MKVILVADAHPALREGVETILSREFGEVMYGDASTAIEVLKKIKEDKWDILILGIDMPPGRNGLEVLKQLKDENIKIPVLIYSIHPEEQIAIRAFKLGASGYLTKDASNEELAKAVHRILSGKKYITESLAELLANQFENPDNKESYQLLSDREYETMLLIAKGKSVSLIAEELYLSVATISTYRTRILQKTGMKNNSELTSYVIRANLA
ncbi:MAG: response regulator transcription factor [Bacteroidia bacterium]